jgi:MFS family permease
MTAVCGLAQNYWTLFLARMGVGVGEATLSPAAYSMLSDSFPKERLGRAVAVYSIGVPLGAGIALVLGGFVVKIVSEMPPVELGFLGPIRAWQLTFFIVGLPGLLVALLMYTLKEPARRGRISQETQTNTVSLRDALRFFARNRGAFLAHFAGLSCLVFVIYGWIAWVPEFFARTYGMSRGDAGLTYGAVQALCGAGGLIAGGWLADRFYARGRADGHLRTILICVLLTLPFFVAMPFMPTAQLALALLIPGTFFSAMHGGVAGAALQLVTPNEMRGQIIALYFFVANLIGLGLGPTAVAATTDFLLRDPALLRYSLSIVAAVALPLSALILLLGLKPFRQSVEAANAAANQRTG